jgi:putative transposase
MGNHVHLLLTSPHREALSRAMRNFGQCYVQAFNKRHRRSGTLWQGRFKSCLVDTDRYLMAVYRYARPWWRFRSNTAGRACTRILVCGKTR